MLIKDLVLMYYNIGLKLIENNKCGSSFIDTLVKDLKIGFPTLKVMSARNLRYMRKFATEFDNNEFLQFINGIYRSASLQSQFRDYNYFNDIKFFLFKIIKD